MLQPQHEYVLYHVSFTAPLVFGLLFHKWDQLFFWFFINTVILNLSALSWRVFSLFRVARRPNNYQYKKMKREYPFRAALAVLHMISFTKFALWFTNAESWSLLHLYHFIQSFIVATVTVFTTIRINYILVKNPPQESISREAVIKIVFVLITSYILLFEFIFNKIRDIGAENLSTPSNLIEYIVNFDEKASALPQCQEIVGTWTFINKFLLLGAVLWVFLSLENASACSPIFNWGIRASKLQKMFYSAVCLYGCVGLQYYTGYLLIFLYHAMTGSVFTCSAYPTINMFYLITVVWFFGLGEFEAFTLLPSVLRRILRDLASDLKYFGSIIGVKVQFFTFKLYEKLGAEIEENQRVRLQRLELQARVRPLSGFDYKLAPAHLTKGEVCSICLEDLCNPNLQLAYWRSCLHFYHEHCLKLWTKDHTECPLCKQQM